MSLQTYGYSAQTKRLKLIRINELLAFIVLVGVVCWLVFPRNLSESLRGSELDAVSKQYIETWLLAKPDDVRLRILLAQELIQFGALDEAHWHLAIIQQSKDKTIADEGFWLHAQLEFERLMAVQPEKRQNHALWEISRQALQEVSYQRLPSRHMLRFIRMALLLGFSQEAEAAAYHWLGGEGGQPENISAVASSFIAYQKFLIAADLYIQALMKTDDAEHQASYFLAALSSYQAGSQFQKGVWLIERFGGLFLTEDYVLYRIVQFSRAANRPALASFYANYLMGFEVSQ